MQFLEKNWSNNKLASAPPLGNPGSTTGNGPGFTGVFTLGVDRQKGVIDSCLYLSHQASEVKAVFEFFINIKRWQYWHYYQLCIPIYLQFSSLFAPIDVSKCEIRNQGVHEDYISGLHALLD